MVPSPFSRSDPALERASTLSEAAFPTQTQRRIRARAAWDRELQRPLTLEGGGEGTAEAWFLGPRAENAGIMHELIAAAIDSHAEFRRGFHPEDPSHITPELRAAPEFQAGLARLRRGTPELMAKVRVFAPLPRKPPPGDQLSGPAAPALNGPVAGGALHPNNSPP